MHFKNKTISFLFNKLKILIVEKTVVRMFADGQTDERTLVKVVSNLNYLWQNMVNIQK